MDNLEKLKFSALFHDIGKFYQRADNYQNPGYDSKYANLDTDDYGLTGAHSKWSGDFVNPILGSDVEDLVLHHHAPHKAKDKELCKIIQKADHDSSKERIKNDEKNQPSKIPLLSIFSEITLDGIENEDYAVSLTKLNLSNSMYPSKWSKYNLSSAYSSLWNDFVDEFKLIKNVNDFETVLALLRKYLSCMPSAVYVNKNDISLYDHSKTTVAMANCRYLFNKEKNGSNIYRVINGDISGIQNFIYKISSPQEAQSGMSKRLRGRSFYITLLCESISNKIINELTLDESNILFCGGGRFIIIAPNTRKTMEVIAKLKHEINKFFIDNFNADLYLSLVSKDIGEKDLKDFGEVISDLNSYLNDDKKHKFVDNLEDVFKIEDKANYDICAVCGNKLTNHDTFCEDCLNHEELGRAIANAEYMIRYNSDFELGESNLFIDFLNVGYIFKNNKKDVIDLLNENPDIKFTLYKINDTDFLDICKDVSNENVSYSFKFIANNVPNIDGEPLYFEHLAKISKGANKLGILKMDVDNLGRIFSQGFNDIGGGSISRISSLSASLDMFFSGMINEIIKNYEIYVDIAENEMDKFDEIKLNFDNGEKVVYKLKKDQTTDLKGVSTIYINYSGGDDLLVLGPYDDIIAFAEEFENKFKEWTCNNESINISGGIILTGSKFPIGKGAKLADDELEKSKNCGKNRITIFDEVLKWKTNNDKIKGFDELFGFGKQLESYREMNKVSSGFIYSLLKIWDSPDVGKLTNYTPEKWREYNFKKISTKHFVPMLMYKLRLVKGNTKDVLARDCVKYMPWIKIPVSWVSLRLR
ncbi:type III-A CRISPR-associated protein Cas10/Csm1 [uncultured Methanobrevibacter sp.]|uniref:type III-A CRISPR-associated protein Cas10/Csm1 n=1 Tax=uncultured Methanobrevibacter sp. TaxID=253161 RepID=UPI0026E041F1|nr:type III-A CRISPR-associated protein Cas10/Csm1 [uncultured Methanobrevibacter sp.]